MNGEIKTDDNRMYRIYEFTDGTCFAVDEWGACGTGESYGDAINNMESNADQIDTLKAAIVRLKHRISMLEKQTQEGEADARD